MKKKYLAVLFLFSLTPCLFSAEKLSSDVVADQYFIAAHRFALDGEYEKALEYFGKVPETAVWPENVYEDYWTSLIEVRKYEDAKKAISDYLNRTGKTGKYYKKALEFLIEIDESAAEAAKENEEKRQKEKLKKQEEERVQREFLKAQKDKMQEQLWMGAINGNLTLVKKALENGADIENQYLVQGWTALHAACGLGPEPVLEVVKFLITRGADVNFQNIDGITPLVIAIRQSSVECVKYLVEHGANIRLKFKESGQMITPFEFAERIKKDKNLDSGSKKARKEVYSLLKKLQKN